MRSGNEHAVGLPRGSCALTRWVTLGVEKMGAPPCFRLNKEKLNGWDPTQCLKKEPSAASHVLSPLLSRIITTVLANTTGSRC